MMTNPSVSQSVKSKSESEMINQELSSIPPKMKENPIKSTVTQISQAFRYRSRRVRLFPGTKSLTCAAIILTGLWTSASTGPTKSDALPLATRASLSFEERVAGQRVIEEVFWRHRTWSADN